MKWALVYHDYDESYISLLFDKEEDADEYLKLMKDCGSGVNYYIEECAEWAPSDTEQLKKEISEEERKRKLRRTLSKCPKCKGKRLKEWTHCPKCGAKQPEWK